MSLKLANPPPGGMEIVSGALARLATARQEHDAALASSGPVAERKLVTPQEVYRISLSDMTGQNPLRAAHPVGWRYLVLEGDQAVEAAESTLGGDGGLRFSHVDRGPVVDGFVEAVHAAEMVADQHPDRDFELRFLRIPGLYVSALWMRDTGRQEGSDILIPVEPVFPPLEADQAYTMPSFFRRLRQPAKRRLEQSDETRG